MSINVNKTIKFLKKSQADRKKILKKYFKYNCQYFTKYINNYKFLPIYKNKGSKMLYNYPLVSVLMPIYNHADMALLALDSIINQSYKNIEIIILDDGSSDNLLELLEPYLKRYSNLKIYTQKNQKLPRALTHLHELTNGEFITWTSADNIMHKNNIEILIHELIKHPEASLVYGDVILIGANGKPYYKLSRDNERDRKHPKIIRLPQRDNALSLEADNYINAAFLYRKHNSDLLKGFYADDFIGAEDFDYWLRLQKSGKLIHIKNRKPLYYYRVHENTMSFDLQKEEKIKNHIMRIDNLLQYEQLRKEYCSQRFYINVEDDVCDIIKENINKLSYNSNLLKHKIPNDKSKIINISKQNSGVLIKNNMYLIVDGTKTIIKEFIGIDISSLAFKARNILSRNHYLYFLENINKPILGCHGDLKNINIEQTSKIISNNPKYYFIIIDTSENIKLKKELEKYKNVLYIFNTKFGLEYRIYSNFQYVISFPTYNDVELIYSSMVLGWSIGRNILHNEKNIQIYPYTYKINYEETIDIKINNIFNLKDYEIMDRYILYFSTKQTLDRVLNFYKCYNQEKYISRPDNGIKNISKSKPIRVTYKNIKEYSQFDKI